MIKSAKKESALKKNVPFDPKVVKGVSTDRDEYLAYISPDDKNCYYVRKMPVNSKNKVYTSDKEVEVFMYSLRDKTGAFDKGEEMPYPFNESVSLSLCIKGVFSFPDVFIFGPKFFGVLQIFVF